MIKDALARSDGVQTRAAELLGMSERGLRYKLIKYGFREEDSDSRFRSAAPSAGEIIERTNSSLLKV